ncbi:MAG: IS3 family transposase [Candidatus Cryptobacteroides sp.]
MGVGHDRTRRGAYSKGDCDRDFKSIEEFDIEAHKHIKYYNEQRIKCRLGGKSPVQNQDKYRPNTH